MLNSDDGRWLEGNLVRENLSLAIRGGSSLGDIQGKTSCGCHGITTPTGRSLSLVTFRGACSSSYVTDFSSPF